MGRRALACVVAGLVIFACGCGGSEDEPAPPTLDELAELVPSGQGVAATDLAAAKEALGLDSQTDPSEGIPPQDADATDAERRFARAALIALPHLGAGAEIPLLEAIDESRVTAAINTLGGDEFTVIATDQPFDEIAAVLEQRGWAGDGETLEAEESSVDPYAAIAPGDGYIAVGDEVDAVEAAAAGEAQPGGPDRDLALELADPAAIARELELSPDFIRGLPGPVAAAARRDGKCVEVIAIADHLADGEAELVLVTTDAPDPEAFLLDDEGAKLPEELFLNRGVPAFGEAVAEGGRLVAPFTYPVEAEGAPYSDFAPGFLRTSSFYRCG
jgi:hypothetical protein